MLYGLRHLQQWTIKAPLFLSQVQKGQPWLYSVYCYPHSKGSRKRASSSPLFVHGFQLPWNSLAVVDSPVPSLFFWWPWHFLTLFKAEDKYAGRFDLWIEAARLWILLIMTCKALSFDIGDQRVHSSDEKCLLARENFSSLILDRKLYRGTLGVESFTTTTK